MVVIQVNKTYFCELQVTLTPWCEEEEPTAAFCQINYVNNNGIKWKWKNTTYFKLLYIKDGMPLVCYRRNGWSQFVGVLIAK